MELLSIGLLFLAAINILTFFAFHFDKFQAINAERRVPERTLLFLAAIGGSLAAKFAQHWLRHKNRKRRFGRKLNAILAVHLMLVILVAGKAAGLVPPLSEIF